MPKVGAGTSYGDRRRPPSVSYPSVRPRRSGPGGGTDRRDGDKVLAMLIRYHAGERRVWSLVRVPTPERGDARRAAHRAR
jgi:hypothetical protein